MRYTKLHFTERKQAGNMFLLSQRHWEIETRASKKVLQMTLRDDCPRLSQFENTQMGIVPCIIVVKAYRYPPRHPRRSSKVKSIESAVPRDMRIATVYFHDLTSSQERCYEQEKRAKAKMAHVSPFRQV